MKQILILFYIDYIEIKRSTILNKILLFTLLKLLIFILLSCYLYFTLPLFISKGILGNVINFIFIIDVLFKLFFQKFPRIWYIFNTLPLLKYKIIIYLCFNLLFLNRINYISALLTILIGFIYFNGNLLVFFGLFSLILFINSLIAFIVQIYSIRNLSFSFLISILSVFLYVLFLDFLAKNMLLSKVLCFALIATIFSSITFLFYSNFSKLKKLANEI